MGEIIVPTLAAMHHKGMPFHGVLYAGLMLTKDGPKLIEYNVRFGDPECQVLMPRLETDLVELLVAAIEGDLLSVEPQWSEHTALSVVMAAKGYPGTPEKGTVIHGIAAAEAEGALVFHAGTAVKDGHVVANGGRVLNVTALGNSVAEAASNAYRAVDAIDWPGGFCRRDIGWRAIAREKA
jgi:phosphoribosylamine--glycine ligase